MSENIFEQASRMKLRFSTQRGALTAEDLWDLPLTSSRSDVDSLDDIARKLNTVLKTYEEESFVPTTAKKNKGQLANQVAFDIVKHIIGVKVAEADAREVAQERAAKKQRLLELVNKKDQEAEANMTREELLAAIDAL